MCEWLASAEWCDVQLWCRGRVFRAHRAVLASVSAFLRKILLSSQDENTPPLIMLPDFDLDAMYSVLYYIYNGEVVIPKSRLESFVDIILTLKIYVDKTYLKKLQESVLGVDRDFEEFIAYNKDVLEGLSSPKPVFKLKSNSTETIYLSIKKGLHSPILMQGAHDVGDKRELCRHLEPYLENIQSLHGTRQKRSLRDSFIEPYPRNGNVNGRLGAVPAILSKHYLEAASILSTNANFKNARFFNVLSSTSHYVDEVTTNAAKSTALSQNNSQPISAQKKSYQATQSNKAAENYITENVITPVVSLKTLAPAVIEQQTLAEKQMSALLDLTFIQSIPNKVSSLACESYVEPRNKLANEEPIIEFSERSAEKSKISVKKSISNHVLQNPWSPRMTVGYKPFRRKLQNKIQKSEIVANDNNNNINETSQEQPVEKPNTYSDPGLLRNDGVSISETPKNHSNMQDIKCNICGQVFPDQASLSTHSKSHNLSGRFTCTECGKTFSQLRNYKYHMSVHRGTREFAATCSVCGKYFNDRGYLSSHMKIHRNRKEYKCHLCPKSFNQRVAYNMHVRIHTGVKPHVCDQCGKAFSRKMLLKQHQRTHSGERPYACAHCDKRFADRSNMTLHLRLHTGVKPFSCSLCPKSFTKKHHLKSHVNFHTGAKPYSCPRCHLAFTQSSNMRTHLKKCNAPLND